MGRISNFDINPANPTLLFNKRACAKNNLGGIFSLLFLLFTIILVFLKLAYVLSHQQVSVQSFTKNQKSLLNISTGNNTEFIMSPQPVKAAIFVTIQDVIYMVTPQEQLRFGIKVNIGKFVSNGTHLHYQDYTEMIACQSNPSKFCPPQNYTISILNSIEDMIYSNYPCILTFIEIVQCKGLYEQCEQVGVFPGMFYDIQLNNNQFDVFQPDSDQVMKQPVQNRPLFDIDIPQDSSDAKQWGIKFTKVQISTDNNIVSNLLNLYQKFDDVKEAWYCPKFREQVQGGTQTQLAIVYMQRSQVTEYYQRTFQRIDNTLADISGVLGTIALILAIFCGSYNSWKMETYVSNCFLELRKQDPEHPKKKRITFLNYLKQTMKSTFYCCYNCCKSKSNNNPLEQQQSTDSSQIQLNSLDILQIIQQLKFLKQQVQRLKKNKPILLSKGKQISQRSLLTQKKQQLLSPLLQQQ